MRKYDLTINNKAISVQILELSAAEAEVEVNGTAYTVSIDRVAEALAPASQTPPKRSVSSSVPVSPPAAAAQPGGSGPGSVLAPIPGSIIDIFVKVGETVHAGEPLFKMEAMKMENEINAQFEGTVTAVLISKGEAVGQGQELMQIAPAAAGKNRRKTDE